jgi:ABC-type transporter Mla MlaB component
MLRITQAESETEQRWTLCGRLTRPWVSELRASWEHRREGGASARAVVDLSDVTFIDESGEALLSEMVRNGVEFIAAGVETKHLLKNLKGNGERPLRRFIGGPVNECEKCGIITNNEGSK